jgi:glycerol-3-phosphate acyltransferase PlsX
MESQRIALDVMGGDDAPRAILAGALRAISGEAAQRLAPERILLVGDPDVIAKGLAELGSDAPFPVRPASQTIGMDETPATALRAKPDSSIANCVGAVRDQSAGAVVSMGNTGAMVGAATLGLKTLAGVKRPGIAVTMSLTGRPVTVLDMGANIAPKPEHLLQYAIMGTVLSRDVLETPKPRVGLLNIGEEASKGTDLLKATHELLTASHLDFAGNIEGGDIFSQKADVIIADGFTGNVVLKLLEGTAAFLLEMMLGELKRHGVSWAPEALENIKRHIDYAEYGGALLLGVDGIVVIGHGRSDAVAVSNALGLAARAMDKRVNEHIVRGLARSAESASEQKGVV